MVHNMFENICDIISDHMTIEYGYNRMALVQR